MPPAWSKLREELKRENINQIARTEGRKAVAEVAAHEQKMLVGVPPAEQKMLAAEQKMLAAEQKIHPRWDSAEQKMQVAESKFNKMLVGDSDDSISDDDLEGVPLAGNWCE